MTTRGGYCEGGEKLAESDKRLDSSEQTEAVGRAYFANEFPNPSRAGCPRPLDLVAAARADRLPDESLRAHLLSCSECFNDFLEARRGAAQANEAAGQRG